MPYSKTAWVDNSTPAISAANLLNIENGIGNAPYGPDASSNQVAVWNGSAWTYGLIANANISNSAAIAYSKLNLAASIVNADISAAAAVGISKLASYPSDGTKALFGDGTWKVPSSGTQGTELDYAQITADTGSISATTEGTAVAVVTGHSITYDGTKNRIEFQSSGMDNGGNNISVTFVVLRDSTVLGQIKWPFNTAIAPPAPAFVLYDTPSAAAHTYKVSAFVSSASTIIKAGAGGSGTLLPTFLRVTKA